MKWHALIFIFGTCCLCVLHRDCFEVQITEKLIFLTISVFRSVSDVPIKIQQLAITISNTKSVYKINAQQWMEIGDATIGEQNSSEMLFSTDFMMQPNKLYKISFAAEQCQFSENSMLSVSI